jgi:hypothetical protein
VTDLPVSGTGRGLRALPRLLLAAGLGLVLLSACSSTHPDASAPSANGASPGQAGVTGTERPSQVDGGVAGAVLPTRIGELELQVGGFSVPESLDGTGGEELRAMLDDLGLTPLDISLVVAVDAARTLAIGRWGLPGRASDSILSAWLGAAGGTWSRTRVGRVDALGGPGPDGSRAWATAADGVFVYVVTDDRSLAEAALAATR